MSLTKEQEELLSDIHNEVDNEHGTISSTLDRLTEDRTGSNGKNTRRSPNNLRRYSDDFRRDQKGPARPPQLDSSVSRSDSGVRPLGTTGEYPYTSVDANATGGQESPRIEPVMPLPIEPPTIRANAKRKQMSPEEWEAHEKELKRQRDKRYADKKKAERLQVDPNQFGLYEVSKKNGESGDTSKGFPRLSFKAPFGGDKKKEKAKLFTAKEVDDNLERMTEIYYRLSGIAGDILVSFTRGHEDVEIWQLSEEESETLAMIHLESAKGDEKAAASARQLLSMYSRAYMYLLIFPRIKGSVQHVRKNGISFK